MRATRRRKREGTGVTARRVLAAQLAVTGGAVLALLAKEIPGIVREVRIWRMVGLGPGPRRRT
ncbi:MULTISPECIES: hypothetical protein [Streptomyces]|uniref:Uncharacterized protein n=1 Tax=Streptomyces thermoviolaceus subsp. thermoviolaceus TaxID=66860 RepID=A0ABX0YR57_STRTL|nr:MULTISPECIES: hypothetical protein [Streptomyces]WTD46208.1 hypothetical protein OG899_00990 [Streptomyces thermoviolaceus]NJP13639.1 hypothetical protein [Streptomyces thermoviolaceus subsp. thermoviolaceus]RSS03630.1 hypothetical protein EF917_12870 [Streptomyces sp. WAC00469]GGV65598.1 hypothetical protein GCM10010499_10010 [Streptomyces thermoviolaceus subsp. apingens]GHA75361.1 hypothetical protein GCM10010512_02120 [Streptomyces thermoviolaceus subsp. thermoviolaceus]